MLPFLWSMKGCQKCYKITLSEVWYGTDAEAAGSFFTSRLQYWRSQCKQITLGVLNLQGHGLNPLNQSWLWNILLLWGKTTIFGKRPTSCNGCCSNSHCKKSLDQNSVYLQDRSLWKCKKALTGEPGLPCAQQRKWPWRQSAWR